jgi:hypothetical protein
VTHAPRSVAGLLRWPVNQKTENNPMHSSEVIGGMRFFRSELTCRAKQGHGVIMPTLEMGKRQQGFGAVRGFAVRLGGGRD